MRKIYLLFIGSALLFSCSLQDNYDGVIGMTEPEPTFDVSTETGQKKKGMYEKYGVIFNENFSFEDFQWDWNTINSNYAPNSTGFRYTNGDSKYVPEVLDSLNKWFFNIFPQEFISSNLPRNIYMCDTLCNRYSYLSSIVYRWLPGEIKTNYMMLGYVSERFGTVRMNRSHITSWVSLLIEKMVSAKNLTIPQAFIELSLDGYAQYSYTNAADVTTLYGLLRKGRNGQNTGTATAAWFTTKAEQDFGDFVAFIIYVPDSEKESYYSKNPVIRQKVGIVKEYFKSVHNITLPYKPRLL